MDTLLLWFDKRIISTMGIALCFFTVGIFSNYIWANEYIVQIPPPVINASGLSLRLANEISKEKKLEEFDDKIQRKYPKSVIYTVSDGIKHIKQTQYYDGKPVKINIIEINRELTKQYELKPILASKYLNHKAKISDIANDAIIAINGTFFKPETGVPLGTLMIDERIYTGPIYDRVALGIFDNGYDMERITLNASFQSKNKTIKVDNINQPRMLSTMTLVYTKDWGDVAPPMPKYGLQLAVKKDRIIKKSAHPIEIPVDGYVIAGPASLLKQFNEGEKVDLKIATIPKWEKAKHIISGGPYLVKNNEIFVDMTAQKLGAIGGKNPRSAIGYTKNNDIILVAVDGREGNSVGMTLMQIAKLMKSLGCTQAMNLDGGGSTVMYVNGEVVNNPQQKGGIAISNAIGLVPKS